MNRSASTCFSFVLAAGIVSAIGFSSDGARAGEPVPHRLEVGRAEVPVGGVADIPLRLSSPEPVQGLAAVWRWNPAVAEGVDVVVGSALADADLVVRRTEFDYMVLGVVVDTDGAGPDAIGPGESLDLATMRLRCLSVGSTEIEFTADGQGFSAVQGGPDLDNQITVAGLSFEREDGLGLVAGGLTGVETPRIAFRIGSAEADAVSGCADVDVSMDNAEPVEGFELSIAHPAGLTLSSISVAGTAASAADFADSDVFEGGGTLGVVMDLVAPFDGATIASGEGQRIAVFSYCCDERSVDRTFDLTFQAGFGAPPKENVAVVAGQAIVPELTNGSLHCAAVSGESEVCDDGVDNDGDGLVDCADSSCAASPACELANQTVTCGAAELADDGLPFTAEGTIGGVAQVSFFYASPDLPGPGQDDQIQGMSLGVCYPCEILCDESSFDTTDTIAEAIGVEFLSIQCDNDPLDGDGCEMVLGMLVDAMPPFDGHTLPPTSDYLEIGKVSFTVPNDPDLCGHCFPIQFCDGINGRGIVPTRNLVSIANFSRPLRVIDCELCVGGPRVFNRGNCNMQGAGFFAVDVADAASILSYLFLSGLLHFDPPCLDACDANDDGRIDLADSLTVLNFIFRFGIFPPAPGPGFNDALELVPAGIDPTEDPLDCEGGSDCAI